MNKFKPLPHGKLTDKPEGLIGQDNDYPVSPPWKVIVLDGDVCINPSRESGEYAIIAHVRRRPNADLIVEAVNKHEIAQALYDALENSEDYSQELEALDEFREQWGRPV